MGTKHQPHYARGRTPHIPPTDLQELHGKKAPEGHSQHGPEPHPPAPNLAQLARLTLDRDPHFRGRGRELQLDCHEGVLTIQGRVPSYYLKQVLQTVLNKLEGISRIENRVEVTPPGGVR